VSRCLGVNPSKDKDPIETRTVNVEFTTHALKTLLALRDDAPPISVTASSPRPPLRFVYISAIGTVQDQQAQLWWLPQYRRTRGLVETELLSILDSQTAKDTAEGNQSPKLELGMTRIFVAWRSNWSFINATFVPLMETIGIINHPVGKLSKQLLKLALDGSRQPIYGVREVMALPTE
jgi:hypothetical protein